jgi:uncharacterized protein with GYD domain
MATFITLYKFTEQGAKDIGNTVTRARQAIAAAEKAGGKVTALVWTQGQYDLVGIGEWASEEAAMAFSISVGKLGNVRTETLRAFNAEEMERILKKVQ